MVCYIFYIFYIFYILYIFYLFLNISIYTLFLAGENVKNVEIIAKNKNKKKLTAYQQRKNIQIDNQSKNDQLMASTLSSISTSFKEMNENRVVTADGMRQGILQLVEQCRESISSGGGSPQSPRMLLALDDVDNLCFTSKPFILRAYSIIKAKYDLGKTMRKIIEMYVIYFIYYI